MYQVTIKGRNLNELKKAVDDINTELKSSDVVHGMEKELEPATVPTEPQPLTVVAPVVEAPIVPPVVEAPITPAAPINVNAELDSEGLPWDKRIHGSGKTKLKKEGTWKLKKGIDKDLVQQIKTEMRNAMMSVSPVAPIVPALPTNPPIQAPIPPVAPIVPALPTNPPIQAPITPVVTPPVQAPIPPVAPMTNNGHTAETFIANFPMILASLITEKKIDQDYINTLNTHFGVTEIYSISDAQKAEMFESFVQWGHITKA